MSNRKLRVRKLRLREKGRGEGGEVVVPAYAAMRSDRRLSERMLKILLTGVSTRRYGKVVAEMAETVGASKSSVSRETIEAGERKLRELAERRFRRSRYSDHLPGQDRAGCLPRDWGPLAYCHIEDLD